MSKLTLSTPEPQTQLQFLQQTRIKDLIKDEETVRRLYEAALYLLTSDKLRACNEDSIVGALYKAATLKFRLEPEFGECYLIPRTVKGVQVCVFQIGYKGWKSKALETGHISFIEPREVYKEDEFSFEYGTHGFLKHRPADENSGQTTHFYARTRLKDGTELFEVINKQAAERSRKNSESQYDWVNVSGKNVKQYSERPKDIWAKHYAAMALRVPIKKLCAMLPLSPAIEEATRADNSVTYLDSKGNIVTISEVEVEKNAVDLSSKAPVEMTEELKEKYDETADYLQTMDVPQIIKFYAEFVSGEFGNRKEFIELFFLAVAQKSTTVEQLAAFYEAAKPWSETIELKSIISKRKKELEQNAKRN